MYHQVKLDRRAVQFFGFSVIDAQGKRRYYVYLVLAFGTSSAVSITDKLTKPIKIMCFVMAIILCLYIDDGLIIGKSFRFCEASYKYSVFLLQMSGWTLQEAKCISLPSNQILYLGYILDSNSMRISVEPSKCLRVVQMISALKTLFNNDEKIACRELAGLCGLLAHLIHSHGSFISVISRHCNHNLGKEVTMRGWESFLRITVDMLVELDMCQDNIFELNGQPLIKEEAVVAVMNPTQINLIVKDIDPLDKVKERHVFVSDSSDSKAFFFKAGELRLTDEYLFTQTEAQLSSSYRELLAVEKSFIMYSEYFKTLAGSLLIWVTDSSCLVSFLEKGSRIPMIQKVVMKIKKLEFQFKLKIKGKWLSRDEELLRMADAGSKLHLCSDQFGISTEDFLNLQVLVGKKFTVDGFGSAVSRKCLKFISACPQQGCLDVDFFNHTMSSSNFYFLHPPPKLLIRLVEKIQCYSSVQGVIILPAWISHGFWSFFVKQGYFEWFVSRFWFISPTYESYSRNTMFQGKKSFKTIALEFDTSSRSRLKCPDFN